MFFFPFFGRFFSLSLFLFFFQQLQQQETKKNKNKSSFLPIWFLNNSIFSSPHLGKINFPFSLFPLFSLSLTLSLSLSHQFSMLLQHAINFQASFFFSFPWIFIDRLPRAADRLLKFYIVVLCICMSLSLLNKLILF